MPKGLNLLRKYMMEHLDPEFIDIINQIKYPLMKAECVYDYFLHRDLFPNQNKKRSKIT